MKPVSTTGIRRFFGSPTRVFVLVGVFVLAGAVFADWWQVLPDRLEATYVGRQSCARCHQEQVALFRDSDHDRAMDLATDDTVLGDFGDIEFTHQGLTSRLFRRDGKFMVHTEGPDGNLHDFEVKYVLGVRPLQQYMVEFNRPLDLPADQISQVQVHRR